MKPAGGKDIPYEVISLDPYSGLSTLFERLDAIRAPRAVIFVPRQLVELRNPLELRLLRRRAAARQCEVYLVCEDLRTRLLAGREGLAAVAGPRHLPRSIRRAARQAGAPPLLRFPRRGLPALLAPVPAVLLGVAAAIGIYFFVPGATVELQPVERSIEQGFVVEAGPEAVQESLAGPADGPAADSGVERIAARVLVHIFPHVTRLDPTGVRREPATAATGQVLLLNRTSEKQDLPRGAEVVKPGGPAFLTIAPVELPAVQWSAARVGIVAKDLGPAGNLPAQTIDRFADSPLNLRASVINEQPTAGGAEADHSFVTPEDYVELRQRMTADLPGAVVDALQKTRDPGESIYPETIHFQVVEEAISHQVGQTTASLALTVTVTARAPVFAGEAVQRAAERVAQTAAGEGFALVPGSLESRPLGAIAWSEDRVRFHARVNARARSAIDDAAIVRRIAGRTPEQAVELLQSSLPLAGPPRVSLFPWWQTTVPAVDWRVRIAS